MMTMIAAARCCSPAVTALRTTTAHLAPTAATAARAPPAAAAPGQLLRLLLATPRRFAGHSKWAKIARSKGAADQARGALFSKHAAAIKAAAVSGDALRLQTAVDKAKRDNTPTHVIDKARDASARGEAMEEIMYEGIGPCATAVLVECLTPSRNRAAKTVRAAFNKFGGELQSSGSVSWQFTARGRFTLPLGAVGGGGGGDWEAAQEQLLEAAMAADGVEDVEFPEPELDGDGDGDGDGDAATSAAAVGAPRVAHVFCDAGKLGSVRNALVGVGLTPAVSEVVRTPQTTVDVPPGEPSEALAEFLQRLEDNEDVQAVHHNAIAA